MKIRPGPTLPPALLAVLILGCGGGSGGSSTSSVMNDDSVVEDTEEPDTGDPADDPVVEETFAIVDTGQYFCFDNSTAIAQPAAGAAFHGQDAQHTGHQPRYTDNGDGTVTDVATALMWAQVDSGVGMNWKDALAWVAAKNAEAYLGHADWRLPNAKELQSIVDYTRSPDTTGSAAIDPVFDATAITNMVGRADYPFYWSSTTHISADGSGGRAVYVAFGRGTGTYDGVNITDVHGAGCQRSDPKDGAPADYPNAGNGPQGDVSRVFNYVRLVRDAD